MRLSAARVGGFMLKRSVSTVPTNRRTRTTLLRSGENPDYRSAKFDVT